MTWTLRRGPVISFLALLSLIMTVSIAAGAPSVSGVSSNSSSVGQYEKFELTFNVGTTASNLYWPYDTSPNQGVPAGVGVSVDGLFSHDNYATTIVQPAFYYQDYDRNNYLVSEGRDWLYPKGSPCWKIRFAPTMLGTWHYKIRVTDSSGTTIYDSPSNTFTCVASSNHGFLHVSPKDSRYFETSDGTFVNFIGLDDYTTCTYDMDTRYATYGSNRINLIRPWWQAYQGPAVFGVTSGGGLWEWWGCSFTTDYAKPGELFSFKMTSNGQAWTHADVKPSTKYRYSVWVKTVGLQGSGDYGVYLQAFNCTQPDTPLTSKINGTADWTQLSCSISTQAGLYEIGYLKVMVSGITSGSVYFTDASLREDLGNGQYGPELLSKPNLNVQQYVSQREAYKADYQVECAKQNGMYLKVCLEEKHDDAFGSIQADGTVGPRSDDNVYASATHAGRTYQQYYWRYIIARYGYATNIHSYEFCNEGDPYNGNHYNAAEALAAYMNRNDPNKHMVTASLWTDFPSKELWTNSSYPDLAFADWHQYVGLQTGSDNLQYIYGWPRGSYDFSTTTYHSAPNSMHMKNTSGNEGYLTSSYPFAITPGHTYTLSCYIKGNGLTESGSTAGSTGWIYPTIRIDVKDGWHGDNIHTYYSGTRGDFMGTYDWKQWSTSFTAESNGHYLVLSPMTHWAIGEIWFDDITLHDDTANEYVEVPNGNFDSGRLDFDSALMEHSIGTQVGSRSSQVIPKPVIRGECGIVGDNVYGSPYKGVTYGGENQQLVDDSSGVWYKKEIWGQINPFGVTTLYWYTANINNKGLHKYAKAYQTFTAGIPLSNGNYQSAKATTSTPTLRAWGQKDLVNNKAHLWIDNIPYNWKNVVDSVNVPAVSGTVTLTGLKDGTYNVEWWDTTAGSIINTQSVTCSNQTITLQVQGLQSDMACKIYPQASAAPASVAVNISASPVSASPGQVITYTITYTNNSYALVTGVILSAAVPAGMTYVTGSAEATGGAWDSTSSKVNWNVGIIAARGTGTRTFQAKVN